MASGFQGFRLFGGFAFVELGLRIDLFSLFRV